VPPIGLRPTQRAPQAAAKRTPAGSRRRGSRRWLALRSGTCSERWTGSGRPFAGRPDGLDAADLNTKIGASTLTIGGLLKHLALVEDEKFTVWLSGAPLGEPWVSLGGPPDGDDADEWVFGSAADDSPEDLYALYDGAVQRSHQRLAAALANGGWTSRCAFSSATWAT